MDEQRDYTYRDLPVKDNPYLAMSDRPSTHSTEWETIPDTATEITVNGLMYCVTRFWVSQDDKTICWIRVRLAIKSPPQSADLINDVQYRDVALLRSNGLIHVEYPLWFEDLPDGTEIHIRFQWRVNSVGCSTITERPKIYKTRYER